MLDKIIFLSILSIATATGFAESTINPKNSRARILQQVVNQDCLKYHLPALSVSLKTQNAPIKNYVSGNYSLHDQRPITEKTLFQIGSLTKTFTASIVFQFIEQHKLNLEDTVTQWLPQYPKWQNITIKNLLTHTSGIENYTHGDKFDKLLRNNPQKIYSLTQLIELAYHSPVVTKPNNAYHYSNTDYLLLGMILESVSKRSLNELFNQYFQRYQLKHTYYFPTLYPQKLKSQIAHGYNRDGTFSYNQDVTFINLSYTQSAGGIISTPNDINLWLEQLLSDKILSHETLAKMTTIFSKETRLPIDLEKISLSSKEKSKPFFEIGFGAGMGLIYLPNSGLLWVHAGGTLGYESFYAFNPKKQIYLAIAYNVKPKQQFIFMNIANDILKIQD